MTLLPLLLPAFCCFGAAVAGSPAHLCCIGRTLRLGLFPVDFPPYWTYSSSTGEFGGFIPEVYQMIAYDIGFVPIVTATTLIPGQLPEQSLFQNLDVTMAQTQAPAYVLAGQKNLSLTATFFDSNYRAVTLKVLKPPGAFRLFDPFTIDLWGANIACIIGSALLLVFFSAIAPSEEFASIPLKERVAPQTVLLSFYHMVALMYEGEEYEWTTWPGRVLRLAMLFLLLVTSASYTANLAAFFTTPVYDILGPKDLSTLASASACTTFDLNMPTVGMWTGSVTALEDPPPGSGLPLRTITERSKFCIDKLKDKSVDVFISSASDIKKLMQQDCSNLALSENLRFGTESLSFVLPGEEQAFARNLSSSIAYLKHTPKYGDLLGKHFLQGRAVCEQVTADTVQLSLQSQRGLFYIFASMAGSATFAAIVQFVLHRRQLSKVTKDDEDVGGRAANQKAEHTMTDGELLRLLVKKVDCLDRLPAAASAGAGAGAPVVEGSVRASAAAKKAWEPGNGRKENKLTSVMPREAGEAD